MTTNIKEQVFPKKNLFSPGNGRDYLKTHDGEIFSINGLYCMPNGAIDRYGDHVKVIDIRWDVVVSQKCKGQERLIFRGDNKDQEILAHYGYRVERDAEGYQNVLPLEA